MTADVIIEELLAIRADLRDVKATVDEHTRRLLRIELEVAELHRQVVFDAETGARLQLHVDALSERVGCIEGHLERTGQSTA